MKKYISILLAFIFCFLFSACENTDSEHGSSNINSLPYDYSSYNTIQSDVVESSSVTESTQDVTSSRQETSSLESVTIPSESSVPLAPISSAVIPTQSSSQAVPSSSVTAPPACNHNYSQTANTATCTKNGQATYACSLCKATYKEQTTSFGHKWDGHKCKTCGTIDEDKMKENLYNWAVANSVEENFSKYYYLPSDSRYKFSAIGKGNYIFYYDDEATSEHISVSVYGFEKNKCYINYILNDLQIEGEFPMDAVHSKDRNFFNVMNAAAAKKDELTTSLRSKIDGFLKKFENEMLIPKTDITLNDLGFKCY